jgi:hypothetical protein
VTGGDTGPLREPTWLHSGTSLVTVQVSDESGEDVGIVVSGDVSPVVTLTDVGPPVESLDESVPPPHAAVATRTIKTAARRFICPF